MGDIPNRLARVNAAWQQSMVQASWKSEIKGYSRAKKARNRVPLYRYFVRAALAWRRA